MQRKNPASWFIVLAIIAVVRKRFPEATVIQIDDKQKPKKIDGIPTGDSFSLTDKNGTAVKPDGPGQGFPSGARPSGPQKLELTAAPQAGDYTLSFTWHAATLSDVYKYNEKFSDGQKIDAPYSYKSAPKTGSPYTVTLPWTAILIDTCQGKVIGSKSGSKEAILTVHDDGGNAHALGEPGLTGK